MDPRLRQLLRAAEGPPEREVEAIVRLANPGVQLPGMRIVAQFGAIVTCRLRRDAIVAVWQDPRVISVKAARMLGPEPEPLLAEPPPPAGDGFRVGDLRRPPGLTLTGLGVVVGIVDWHCGFPHLNFRHPDGSTRLLALWDQRPGHGDPPQPYGYGTVYDATAINRALKDPNPYTALGYRPDDAGHGTHVMDIAAGGGRAGPAGLACDAQLVFVHLADQGTSGLANLGDSCRILEACDFVRRTAGRRPWVINCSVGRHGGPHDGCTLIELAFDRLLSAAPGCFLTLSTGNYFNKSIHACGRLTPGETRTLRIITDEADETANELEVWYDGDDEFAVRVASPTGWHTPWIGLCEQADILDDAEVVGRIYHRCWDPNNHDHHIDMFLDPTAPAGEWAVTLNAVTARNGSFHAWLERDEACQDCQAHFVEADADPTSTTGTLANGHLPLTVGAYNAHSSRGELTPFSSAGDTRDGRSKPDLVAPGSGVLAARSSSEASTGSSALLVRMSGTSMAAPHVTGAVALCLQADPALSATRIRELVQYSAIPMPEADPARVGAGRLDTDRLEAAVLARRRPTPALQHRVAQPTKPRKELAMSTPEAQRSHWAGLDADRLYRELVYRRTPPPLTAAFNIVALPGEAPRTLPQSGDLLVRVALGHPGLGHVAVVSDPELIGHDRLATASGGAERGGPGFYATVTEAGALQHTAADRFARLILDPRGRMPDGQLLLRPQPEEPATPDEDEEATGDLGSLDALGEVAEFGSDATPDVLESAALAEFAYEESEREDYDEVDEAYEQWSETSEYSDVARASFDIDHVPELESLDDSPELATDEERFVDGGEVYEIGAEARGGDEEDFPGEEAESETATSWLDAVFRAIFGGERQIHALVRIGREAGGPNDRTVRASVLKYLSLPFPQAAQAGGIPCKQNVRALAKDNPDTPRSLFTGRYESTNASGSRYFWAINQAGNTVIAIRTLRGFSERDGGRASREYRELRGDIQADGTAVLFQSDNPETFWGYLQAAEKPGRLRWHYSSYLGADGKRIVINAEPQRDEVLVWQSADNRPTLMESLYKSDDNYLSVLLQQREWYPLQEWQYEFLREGAGSDVLRDLLAEYLKTPVGITYLEKQAKATAAGYVVNYLEHLLWNGDATTKPEVFAAKGTPPALTAYGARARKLLPHGHHNHAVLAAHVAKIWLAHAKLNHEGVKLSFLQILTQLTQDRQNQALSRLLAVSLDPSRAAGTYRYRLKLEVATFGFYIGYAEGWLRVERLTGTKYAETFDVIFATVGKPKFPTREELFDLVVTTTQEWMPGDFEGTLYLGEVTAFVGVKPAKVGATLMGGYLRSKNGLLIAFENAEPYVKGPGVVGVLPPGSPRGKQDKPKFKVRAEGMVGRVRRRTDKVVDWSTPFLGSKKVTGNLVAATHFCHGSSLLTPAARQLLRVVCADQLAALDSPTSRLWIIGHTDRTDTDARNIELSKLRAKNVETALKDILGDALNPEVKNSILVLYFGEWLARFKLHRDDVRNAADRRVDLVINGSLAATFRE